MNYDWKGQIVNILPGGLVTIHSIGQTTSTFPYVRYDTAAGEIIHEVSRRARGIGKVGDKASKQQGAGVYSSEFAVRTLARVRGSRIKVGSDNKLTKVRRVAECNYERMWNSL